MPTLIPDLVSPSLSRHINFRIESCHPSSPVFLLLLEKINDKRSKELVRICLDAIKVYLSLTILFFVVIGVKRTQLG